MIGPVVIPPDPRLVEISKQITKSKRKRAKKQWVVDHFFDIVNLIIALASLAVSFLSLLTAQKALDKTLQVTLDIQPPPAYSQTETANANPSKVEN